MDPTIPLQVLPKSRGLEDLLVAPAPCLLIRMMVHCIEQHACKLCLAAYRCIHLDVT